MEGEDLQSKVSSILQNSNINPKKVSNNFDVLHAQTENGAQIRNSTVASNIISNQGPIPNTNNNTITKTSTNTLPNSTIAQLSKSPIQSEEEKKESIDASLNKIKLNIIKDNIAQPIKTEQGNIGQVQQVQQTQPVQQNPLTQNQSTQSQSPILNNSSENENKNVATTDFKGQKPIRTYESDMAEAMTKKRASVAKIVIAENSKNSNSEVISNKESSNIGKNILKFVFSLIFIVAGGFGAYYLYTISPLAKQPVVKQEGKIPSVITPDALKVVSAPELKKGMLTQFVNSQFNKYDIPNNQIYEIVPAIKTAASTTIKLGSKKFIEAMGFEITDTLKRSLTDRWMLGIYSYNGKNIPFIILTNDFFQNAFAGMLKWEETMPDEFMNIFDYKEIAYRNTSNSTSTISNFYNIKGNFEDKVIKNRDIREFKTQNGEMLLLYTFLDKNTILITDSEIVIPALIERIEKQTYIR